MVLCVQWVRYVFIFCSLSHARFALNHTRYRASLENTEDPERSPLFFIESGGTDWMKALSAISASRLQILSFAEDMRLMENRYLPDSP